MGLKSGETMDFQITDAAQAQIEKLIQEETEGSFFRISINAGGCSGFEYHFIFDDCRTEDDIVFNKGNIQVVIDEVSLSLLKDGILDYTQDLFSAKFTIINPNAATGCGCGNSFSI